MNENKNHTPEQMPSPVARQLRELVHDFMNNLNKDQFLIDMSSDGQTKQQTEMLRDDGSKLVVGRFLGRELPEASKLLAESGMTPRDRLFIQQTDERGEGDIISVPDSEYVTNDDIDIEFIHPHETRVERARRERGRLPLTSLRKVMVAGMLESRLSEVQQIPRDQWRPTHTTS